MLVQNQETNKKGWHRRIVDWNIKQQKLNKPRKYITI